MHDIRRATLFAPGRHSPDVQYDENHPHDLHADNHCYLLTLDNHPIGVVRLDKRGEDGGVVRLVAIVPKLKGQGHGRILGQLVDAEARRRGMTHLVVNAAETAVGYYSKTGWTPRAWDPSELVGIASSCVQMQKAL